MHTLGVLQCWASNPGKVLHMWVRCNNTELHPWLSVFLYHIRKSLFSIHDMSENYLCVLLSQINCSMNHGFSFLKSYPPFFICPITLYLSTWFIIAIPYKIWATVVSLLPVSHPYNLLSDRLWVTLLRRISFY
jgi:hypothetical protein